MNITLTRKIKVGVYVPSSITDDNEIKEYKDFAWKRMRDISRLNFELHNMATKKMIQIDAVVQSQLNEDHKFLEIKKIYEQDRKNENNKKQYFSYINEKRDKYIESLGSESLNSYIYTYLVLYIKSLSLEQQIGSYIYCAISKNTHDKFKNDYIDVSKGLKNFPYYKKTVPIPLNIKAPNKIDENGIKSKNLAAEWFNKYDDNTYTFDFKYFSNKKIELRLIFGKDKSNNKCIIDRLIFGDPTYKLCDSDIQIIDNEIYLLLSIKQFDVNTNKNLDPKKIMGVDLGMKCAAYVATNISSERKQIGDRKFALLKTKLAIEKDRRLTQRNSQFNRGGHGRSRKLQKLNIFKKYEKNFRDTFNHQISLEIIKTALQWCCGEIHVENLSQIPRKEKDCRVLRNWSYFDLLNKIEYKAKMNGIKFVKVNPAYTSQICHVCGKKGERFKQDTFICTNPDCKQHDVKFNADHNAAINIAKSIEIFIE